MTDKTAAAPQHHRKALWLILPFLWPRDDLRLKLWLVGAIAILIATAAVSATAPILLADAIDRLEPVVGKVRPGDVAALAIVGLLVGYGAMHWLSRVLNEFRWLIYGRVEQRTRRRVGLVVFRHLHSLSLRFHLARRTGSISHILDNGMRGIEDLLFDCIFLILPLVAQILIIAGIMLVKFQSLFAVVIVVILLLYVSALIIGSEWLRKHQRRAVVVGTKAQGMAIDSLLNYETIKFSGNEEYVARRYDDALGEVERLKVRSSTWRSLTGIIQVSIMGVGITTIVLMACDGVLAGEMTIGGFVLVNTYLLQLIRPLDRLGYLYREIKQALVDLEQMMGLLDEQPEIVDEPDARPLPLGRGRIVFDSVSFAYDARRPVLHRISFTLPESRTVALVGPSGAGKSTIGRLLFRFYDASEGRITIDGADVRKVTQDSLRAAIAVVPQDTVLFNESLYYNIAFGRPDCGREEVEQAARMAQIHDFIASLPDGYDTVVGERGLKLSGGEKQRVAVARAVLKNPRIFLFDEATSSLDSHTELAIQQNLNAVSRNTTTLIIAHRLSTVVHADEILFFEDGRIVERGSHAKLLAADGRYAAMWRRQQEHREADAMTA